MSRAIERAGLADLTIDQLRPTDHLNPLVSRAHLDEVADARRLPRSTVPVLHADVCRRIAENIARACCGPCAWRDGLRVRHQDRPASISARHANGAPRRESSTLARRGIMYRALQAMTSVVMLDVGSSGECDRGRSSRCCEAGKAAAKAGHYVRKLHENSVFGHRSVRAGRPWRVGARDGRRRRARRTGARCSRARVAGRWRHAAGRPRAVVCAAAAARQPAIPAAPRTRRRRARATVQARRRHRALLQLRRGRDSRGAEKSARWSCSK